MKGKWTVVKRKRDNSAYQPSHEISSWLARYAGIQGLDGHWYMTSDTRGKITSYNYHFKDEKIAVLFKLTFGGTV